MLLTHGHNDHVGDAVAILKKSGAMLVADFEICMFLVGQGVDGGKIDPGNFGGTVDCGGFTTTFVAGAALVVIRGRRTAATPISAIPPAWCCVLPMTRRSIAWATPTSSQTWR